MAKYTDKLAIKIAVMIEEDTYTITGICEMMGVSRKTFYEWKDTKPQFKEMLQTAEEIRYEKLLHLARTSRKKKLEGYTLTEEKITYTANKNEPGGFTPKSKVVKHKHYPPDNTAIRQVLEAEEKRQAEEKQEQAEAEKQATEKKPELVIEYNTKEARKSYEFLRTMLKAGIPNHKWKEYTYSPAYMNVPEGSEQWREME